MNTFAQTRTMRRALLFGLAMLGSAWALALAVPLLRYSDLDTPAGQFFRTHRSGFAPLYALLGAQGARGVALLLGAGVVYGVVALLYWRLLQRLAARSDDVAAIWRSRWHWLLLGLVWLGWLLAYPLLSDDTIYYLLNARGYWNYNLNPYLSTTLPALQHEPWRAMIGVDNPLPLTYGPLWLYMSLPVVAVAGASLTLALLGIKLLVSLALVGCLLILWHMLDERAERQQWLLALLWNPFVALEVLWSGHNDPVMLLWMLLALLALRRTHHTAAICLLMLGAATKFVPLICLPLLLAQAIQNMPTFQQRWRFVLGSSVIGGGVLLLVFAPMLREVGGAIFTGVAQQAGRVNPSVGALFQYATAGLIGTTIARASTTVLLAVLIGYFTWRVWQGAALPDALMLLLVGYILIISSWYVPWYGLWPLLLAPLAQPWLRRALVLITLLLPLYYIVNIVVLPAWLLVLCNAGLPLLLLWRAWRTQQRALSRAQFAEAGRL